MGYSYACVAEYLNGRPLDIDIFHKPLFYLITSHPPNWVIYWLVGDIELKLLGLNQSICRGRRSAYVRMETNRVIIATEWIDNNNGQHYNGGCACMGYVMTQGQL